jgi:acyl carrier protein phosphodiesterase
MNWLAHLYLSEPNAQFRVGNLLPDLTSVARLAFLPEPYQQGIRCHRRIDLFTDSHPRVQSCVRRFPPPYRRYGGILTDVYFDYFLARDWTAHSIVPLAGFISEIYRDIETCSSAIPEEAKRPLQRIREENWLGFYHRISGVTDILGRMGRRFRRPFDLAASLPIFQEHETGFLEDFQIFFPELTAHVQSPCLDGPQSDS